MEGTIQTEVAKKRTPFFMFFLMFTVDVNCEPVKILLTDFS
ncbi:hypothetical protein SAMN05216238_102248 [Lentibacillus persicus]|uniref:Uncharacterized protein n=1 Tax=Lentibacillus persicus TaxID=640948 RepID=A0A1I1TF87_9BACI|nr:hypothetical protein SAMN05216238_102248 [Lentibacillus persicus]